MDSSSGQSDDQLGQDKFTSRVVLEFAIIFIGLVIMAWFTFNTTLQPKAFPFLVFGLLGFTGMLAAFVITKTDFNINAPISEEPLVPVPRKIIYIISLLTGLATFFLLAKNRLYTISAPMFQVADTGAAGNVAYTFIAALFEDILFFVVIAGLIFALVRWRTDSSPIAFAAVLIGVPLIFMLYHIGVYGLFGFGSQDLVANIVVFIFGFEMMVWMVVLRDITYVHLRHGLNNVGILIFLEMGIGLETLFTMVFLNPVTWVVIIGLIIVLLLEIKRRRG